MSKYFSKFLFLFGLIIFITSCQKDSTEFVPTGDAITVDASIFGVVVDESQEPIQGATILYRGQSITTDEYGIYKFDNVKVNSKHNHINITKEGYFEGTRTFRTNHTKTLTLKTQLLTKSFDQSFNSDQGGVVKTTRSTLTFLPNSIMDANSKEPYSGEVTVAMKYLDPTQIEVNEQMPGDLSAVNTENVVGTLASYGMVSVELQSPSGQKLQVKTGSTAQLSTEIPSKIASNAPGTIPMWYFDDATGLWVEEGLANLNGDIYTANVSHFSWWNYDAYQPSIVLSGKVIDQDGNPLENVHVWVSVQGEWGGGHGNTDADGTFSGQVAKDEILDFKIFSYSNGCGYIDPVYITQIGAFSTDTDMGDIVVTVTTNETLSVKANFIKCDGNPVTNGFVRMGYNYFELDGAPFDQTVVVCNNNDQILTATDRDALKKTEPIIVNSPGNEDLGTLSICALEVDFFNINCDALSFSETLVDSLTIFSYQNGATKGINAYDGGSGKNTFIYLQFEDLVSPDFNLGTYPLTGGIEFGYNDPANPNKFISYVLNSGTITITQGGTVGDIILGTINMNVKNSEDNLDYDFYGDFQITSY